MTYKDELEQVRQTNGGILRAGDVVEYARDETTKLHDRFDWNDTSAAKQYRLWQARVMINVVVTRQPQGQESTRVYVSLADDRKDDGGGYRTLDDVMRSKAMREALLKQAHGEMARFAAKYRQLTELAVVISAMDATSLLGGHQVAAG